MKETYNEGMAAVYADEGGYSNDVGDSGGPTKYGITIIDARKYWKVNATADDVKNMTKDVAADIYAKHYAAPIYYNDLPAGVDYAVLDYGINSGIHRAVVVLQKIVGTPQDGAMGPLTIAATLKMDRTKVINAIYDERVAFLRGLGQRLPQFLKGWLSRCNRGRKLALELAVKYPSKPKTDLGMTHGPAGAIITAGVAAGYNWPHMLWYIGGATMACVTLWYLLHNIVYKETKNVA